MRLNFTQPVEVGDCPKDCYCNILVIFSGNQNNRPVHTMPSEPMEVNLTVEDIIDQYPWIDNPQSGELQSLLFALPLE